MKKVAVLGASGFIGSRVVEMLHLGGGYRVVPIARRPEKFANAARFALEMRVADARDETSLVGALDGATHLVHAVAGEPATILESVKPVYRAAAKARVKRIIVLSSASVHGQSPALGVNETFPLKDDHLIEYNNAKVRAERAWLHLRGEGNVEIVLLRPSIVHGPRSFWISAFANDLLNGCAYVIEGGRGVCNAIHVDNLVHAIRLAFDAQDVDGKAFLLRDEEALTWKDLLSPVATMLGVEFSSLSITEDEARAWVKPRRWHRAATVIHHLPRPVVAALRAAVREWRGPVTPRAHLDVTDERILLHTCTTRLPIYRAQRDLGYVPIIDFNEGCRRTLSWLAFAGYPPPFQREVGSWRVAS